MFLLFKALPYDSYGGVDDLTEIFPSLEEAKDAPLFPAHKELQYQILNPVTREVWCTNHKGEWGEAEKLEKSPFFQRNQEWVKS